MLISNIIDEFKITNIILSDEQKNIEVSNDDYKEFIEYINNDYIKTMKSTLIETYIYSLINNPKIILEKNINNIIDKYNKDLELFL